MDSSNISSIKAVPESFLQAASHHHHHHPPSNIPGHHSYINHHHDDEEEEEDENIIIDLGLSLGTSLQPDQLPYHHYQSSGLFVSPAEYGTDDQLMGWPQLNPNYMRNSSSNVYRTMMMTILQKDRDEETEGVVDQSNEAERSWAYVKVNMEGVVVGRKVCILEHAGYTSLAIQLEDMFGRQCVSGLRLFNAESEFMLFYKDSNEHWRRVGDVPWKEFVDCVKRLRITRKDEDCPVLCRWL